MKDRIHLTDAIDVARSTDRAVAPASSRGLSTANSPNEIQARVPELLVLLCCIGNGVFAIPAGEIQRVVRMASLTALPGAPNSVIGSVNVEGTSVPVVDPHPLLGIASPVPHPSQQLLLLAGDARFAIWVDKVERAEMLPRSALECAPICSGAMVISAIAHVGPDCFPYLDTQDLRPAIAFGNGARASS